MRVYAASAERVKSERVFRGAAMTTTRQSSNDHKTSISNGNNAATAITALPKDLLMGASTRLYLGLVSLDVLFD